MFMAILLQLLQYILDFLLSKKVLQLWCVCVFVCVCAYMHADVCICVMLEFVPNNLHDIIYPLNPPFNLQFAPKNFVDILRKCTLSLTA